ncbi:PhoH family protein [Chitinasiproducens palmae]|uniref:PhoH-like protein n=1 Tax=Chitinasiproducens palmae TaxID=1770053 RepID=A0A1H2PPA0_9BURK|nr:PhoH family protein [Chitinasiproducens palmae]SDV48089.1 phosphate starvation-inducible protein PhoH [Chitinasiproducens palmae]
MKSNVLEFNAPRGENSRLANLCGPLDENLRQLEQGLDVVVARRGHQISVKGRNAKAAVAALEELYNRAAEPLSVDDVQLGLVEARHPRSPYGEEAPANGRADGVADDATADSDGEAIRLHTRRPDLRGRTPTQRDYLKAILNHDVAFGIGPAGTGKTYLAVACAVDALERDQVKRIVLTRPAVEAGERLGFLPGDLAQKIDPYLRPLYDALYDLLGFDRTAKLFERQAIEIAPLAYMRGRTLNHAFIILDEAQNTTPEQMKMFLTRIGFGSKAVITGDTTQIDLPRGHKSGLIEAVEILKDVRGIEMTRFSSADVVRHPLVARIVEAYDAATPRDAA